MAEDPPHSGECRRVRLHIVICSVAVSAKSFAQTMSMEPRLTSGVIDPGDAQSRRGDIAGLLGLPPVTLYPPSAHLRSDHALTSWTPASASVRMPVRAHNPTMRGHTSQAAWHSAC